MDSEQDSWSNHRTNRECSDLGSTTSSTHQTDSLFLPNVCSCKASVRSEGVPVADLYQSRELEDNIRQYSLRMVEDTTVQPPILSSDGATHIPTGPRCSARASEG